MKNKLLQRKLRDIIDYAYREVSYYSDYDKNNMEHPEKGIFEKIKIIPILEKDEAVLRNNEFLSNECIPLMLQNKLHMENTSGSTGKYMEVYWKKADYQRSLLPLYIRRRQYYGISPRDRLCYFFTSRKLGKEEILTEKRSGNLGFSKCGLNEERLKEIYGIMNNFQPRWIMGQPSVVLLLAQIKKKYSLPDISNLKYIELTGEMLFENIRMEIEDAFHCSIANHYGAMEVNTIAYECPFGKMHLTNSTYTEIIDQDGKRLPDGEEGDICITTLENFAMPFIRYRVGDRGRILKFEKCKCGLDEKVLELTTGRVNDYILTREGENINSYVFVRAINAVNRCLEQAVKQFSIRQRGYGKFVVNLVVTEMREKEMIQKIFKDNVLQKELDDAQYEFNFFDHLFPDDQIGKLKYFIREEF